MRRRLFQVADYYGLSMRKFEEKCNLVRGNISSMSDSGAIGSDKLAKILDACKEIDLHWLLTGQGDMLAGKRIELPNKIEEEEVKSGVPYWNLPVSAGHSVIDLIGGRTPDGYVSGLPGADMAENILPVTGTSMEPEISSGAIVGVRRINNWETLNTERVYLIITQDDRMIKRIEYDQENEDIIWCVSPNYPKFKIFKSEIIEVQRVCFVYNPK